MRHCCDVRIQDRGWMDFPYDQMGIEWGRTSDDDDNNKPKVGWSAWSAINIRQPVTRTRKHSVYPENDRRWSGLWVPSPQCCRSLASIRIGQSVLLFIPNYTHTYIHTHHTLTLLPFLLSFKWLIIFIPYITLLVSCHLQFLPCLSLPYFYSYLLNQETVMHGGSMMEGGWEGERQRNGTRLKLSFSSVSLSLFLSC